MEKKFLYTQLPCPQDKEYSDAKVTGGARKKTKSIKIIKGQPYDFGGLTATFVDRNDRQTIIQDGTRYLSLGTAVKGKEKMRIIMTKELSSETEPITSTSSANNARRVTGFKITQVEPKNNSQESWCNKVVEKVEKKDKVTKENTKISKKYNGQYRLSLKSTS